MQVFSDSRCLLHEVPPGFPEQSRRLESILAHLQGAGASVRLDAGHRHAPEAVRAIHDESYLERLQRAAERGDGLIDSPDNPLSAGTWSAAWGAVEATLEAADWMVAEPGRRAFAAVRPPGHHAEWDRAMGFCYLNNVAVAAEYLLRRHGVGRLAIVDIDVHHGNGTQHLFEARADVFYASTHQYPFYPGTGAGHEKGTGAGEGATLNIPLPGGTGDRGYREALQGVVLPRLRSFSPEVLLISAGFDAWQDDPIGGMRVSALGFADWGRWLGLLADEACQGRALAVLEGGYDLLALPELVRGFLQGLDGA